MKLKDRLLWLICTIGLTYFILCATYISRTTLTKQKSLRVRYEKAVAEYKKWLNSNDSYFNIGKMKLSVHAAQKNIDTNNAPKSRKSVFQSHQVKDEIVVNELIERNSIHNSPMRRPKTVSTPPTDHISFLKVHMAGSTPLQSIFFRYGFEKNLSFIVPKAGHYFTKATDHYEPILPPKQGNHYDIVCYHACFNFTLFSSLLPRDTAYIAIVRNPYEQFVQSFYFYSNFFSFEYLTRIPDPKIDNIINYPDKYDESCLSYTMNAMARDFGFQRSHYYDYSMVSAQRYLESIADVFQIVIVYEKFEESLILMKNILNWPLKNILFAPEKMNTPDAQIKPYMLQKFKRRNKLDYLLYEYFLKKITDKIREGGKDLADETVNLKLIQKTVLDWCSNVYFGKITIQATRWNEEFDFTSADCELLEKSEFAYIELLRGKN